MIRLLNPGLLPLAIAVAAAMAVLYAYLLHTRRRLAAIGGYTPLSWHAATLAKLAVPVLIALAATGPVIDTISYQEVSSWKPRLAEAPETVRNITSYIPVTHIILIDVSKSMSYYDGGVRRIDEAREFVRRYLESLRGNNTVYIGGFSATVEKICYGAPRECIGSLDKLNATRRYTAIGDALAYAQSLIYASGTPGVVIVVTDGANNYGSSPVLVARSLVKAGVPVLIVRVGLDPRANTLLDTLQFSGVEVVSVNQYTASMLQNISSRAAIDLREAAAVAPGVSTIRVAARDIDPSPTIMLLLAAVAIALAALLEGV